MSNSTKNEKAIVWTSTAANEAIANMAIDLGFDADEPSMSKERAHTLLATALAVGIPLEMALVTITLNTSAIRQNIKRLIQKEDKKASVKIDDKMLEKYRSLAG